MRKITTFAILSMFVFASVAPAFGQRADVQKTGRRVIRAADFETVRAMSDGDGVLVRWQMRSEKDIAVYYVYRVGEGSKELISPIAVPGSAGRFGSEVVRGEVYNFFDTDGAVGARYSVEGLARDGQRYSTKEFEAVTVKSIEAETGVSSEVFRSARLSTNSDIQRNSATITGELLDFVSLYEQEPNPEMQRMVAAQPGAKVAVKRDGFYRVTAAELQSAGFPINSDSTKWRMFMNGNEQAITVGPDGAFVDFYGRGLDTPETDTRYYYLFSDTVVGKRIGTKVLRQRPGAAEATRYVVKAGKKERNFYEPRLFNYEEENFFGRFLNDVPSRINFNLSAVDDSAPARIRVTLVGFTENNHRFSLKVNGNVLPDITQFGRVSMWTEVDIPGSHLVEGTNEIELASSGFNDQALFDRVEVSYQRKYTAEQSKISFTTPGDRKVDIDGFSTSAVRVYDLSFEGNPVQIVNMPIVEGESGFTVNLPSSRPMVGFAVEDAGLLQSPSVTANLPSSLSAATNAAEMVIISHSAPSFLNEAQNWAAYRESAAGGRITTKVIDVQDIYDEFSFGEVRFDAIRNFLGYTIEEWETSPTYVMLVGDGSYDPRNYEGYGFNNLIPSAPTRFIIEESYSDDALVDFDEDGLQDLAIGRIPARTSAQVATALGKVQQYELNQVSFDRGFLFAYDNAFDFDFEGMSQILASELPAAAPREFVVAGTPTSNSTLISTLNQGKAFVNYSGHGAAGLWSSTNFFSIVDVPSLTHANNPSIFSMLTCMNGYFLRTNADSLSESLLFRQGGGAAAAWASTSLTTPDVQLIMAQRFIRQMSAPGPGNIERLGPLIKDSKTVIEQGADVRLSWVLIGDPAMKTP